MKVIVDSEDLGLVLDQFEAYHLKDAIKTLKTIIGTAKVVK